MKISVEDNKLLVTDTQYSDRALYGSIPGARWNKRMLQWEYPASPFVMARFEHKLSVGYDHPSMYNSGVQKILADFHRMKRRVKHKALKEPCMTDLETGEVLNYWEPLPYVTKTTAWNHQYQATNFIFDKDFAYLAMDMGTGKTLVAINEMMRRGCQSVLIICPKSVIDVWVDELERHAPKWDRVVVPLKKGGSSDKAKQCEAGADRANALGVPFLCIVNYESVWRGALGKHILETEWDIVIGDEGHKIKSPGGKASRFCARLAKRATVRILLSGTPLPNNPLDMYGQARFLDPGIFGTSFTRYRNRYAEVVTYKGFPEIVGWKNEDEFNRILDLIMFRVDKDVLDLPPLTHNRRYVELPEKTRILVSKIEAFPGDPMPEKKYRTTYPAKVYRELKEQFVSDVESGIVTAANALTRLLRLQQITSGFVKDDDGVERTLHTEKEEVLSDIIEGTEPPIVVFCRFRRDLGSTRRTAGNLGRNYHEVSGSEKSLVGGRIRPDTEVLGVQIQVGGLGVNLSRARYGVFYSLGFSLADYLQCIARLHRGGQSHPVSFYHILAKGTVDEQVYAALAEKKKVVDAIMDYVKGA